jgi:hypothetical protein
MTIEKSWPDVWAPKTFPISLTSFIKKKKLKKNKISWTIENQERKTC